MTTSEIERLRAALRHVAWASLLNIRRAAFEPPIGTRYTETVRLDIEKEIRALETFVLDVLHEGEAKPVDCEQLRLG